MWRYGNVFRWRHVGCSTPGHYLNQCWRLVIWTRRNVIKWNFNWNSNILILKNAFESVVCEMAVILSRSFIMITGLWSICPTAPLSSSLTDLWCSKPILAADYLTMGSACSCGIIMMPDERNETTPVTSLISVSADTMIYSHAGGHMMDIK